MPVFSITVVIKKRPIQITKKAEFQLTITAVMVKQAHFEFITAVIIISTGSGKEALSFTPNNQTMSFTPRILKRYFMRSN